MYVSKLTADYSYVVMFSNELPIWFNSSLNTRLVLKSGMGHVDAGIKGYSTDQINLSYAWAIDRFKIMFFSGEGRIFPGGRDLIFPGK